MSNFFRKELSLGSKRWHRLIMVIWILSIIFALWVSYEFIKEGRLYAYYDDHRVYVGNIKDRLTSNVVDLKSMIKQGEYLDTKMDEWDTSNFLDIPYGVFWCSNKWNMDNLMKAEELSKAHFYNANSRFNSIDDFRKIEQTIKGPCIFKVSAIELRYDELGVDELYIFNIKHPNKTMVTLGWFMPRLGKAIVGMLLYVIITLVIYYKGVIYIIYGPSKPKKSD